MRFKSTYAGLGIGPLHETPPGGPTGDPAPGGAPAGGTPPAGGGTPPNPEPDRSAWIPRARFDEINGELATLKRAEADRQADEQKNKGEFEKLHATEKARREQAAQRAGNIARRAARIGPGGRQV